MKPIYLDYNATTPVDPMVIEEMLPYLSRDFGNPSSGHTFGSAGKRAVALARERVADLINCEPDEIIFTSGGSESNNHAIAGYARANKNLGRHIITTQIEHPSVKEVFEHLKREGFEAEYIGVDDLGRIDIESLKDSIREDTILVSCMHSNNEVGTIQPLEEISEIVRAKNIVLHTDAAQSAGKIPVDVKILGVDLLSIAGHKLYAPKGIGALYVRRGIRLERIIHGASHERGMRAGTENVPYIAGLGKACLIAKEGLVKFRRGMEETRDELHNSLKKDIPGLILNGDPSNRLPNTLSVSFPKIEAGTMLSELVGVAASPGAACHSHDAHEISYVLQAMGKSADICLGTVRFSTGRETQKSDIEDAASRILAVYRSLAEKIGGEMAPSDGKVYRLTSYTQGLGCACKLRPKLLEEVLRDFPAGRDKNVLVGMKNSDDAAVYRIDSNLAIVGTADFFTPIVDDPFDFGRIAAANSLSDIYAMGAKPLFALNIVGFPSKRLPIEVLRMILSGAAEKAFEAGIEIVGGHTVDDTEPKFGLAVTGIVDPKNIKTNAGARVQDALVLTKHIGTGIISTAVKRGLADEKDAAKIIEEMANLNKEASCLMIEYGASACTDITGFGLLGHALEMAKASGCDFEIESKEIPIFENARKYAQMGAVPGGTISNLEHFGKNADWAERMDEISKIILADAQTSGGLLISIPPKNADKLISELCKRKVNAAAIGSVVSKGKGRIKVL